MVYIYMKPVLAAFGKTECRVDADVCVAYFYCSMYTYMHIHIYVYIYIYINICEYVNMCRAVLARDVTQKSFSQPLITHLPLLQ